MRRFFDLHVIPNLQDEAQIEGVLEKLSKLGYRGVGLVLPSSIRSNKVSRLRRLCEAQGLDFVRRVDLNPSNPKELLSMLKRVRRRFEVVSVLCNSKAVARQAAKDKRVDLLDFPPNSRCRFDRAEAELASRSNAALEVNMASLLSSSGYHLTQLLRELRIEVSIAENFKIPVVLSSGASEDLALRCPRDWTAVASLFDMDEEAALRALSDTPLEIIHRNRSKLDPNFLLPGVRLIAKG